MAGSGKQSDKEMAAMAAFFGDDLDFDWGGETTTPPETEPNPTSNEREEDGSAPSEREEAPENPPSEQTVTESEAPEEAPIAAAPAEEPLAHEAPVPEPNQAPMSVFTAPTHGTERLKEWFSTVATEVNAGHEALKPVLAAMLTSEPEQQLALYDALPEELHTEESRYLHALAAKRTGSPRAAVLFEAAAQGPFRIQCLWECMLVAADAMPELAAKSAQALLTEDSLPYDVLEDVSLFALASDDDHLYRSTMAALVDSAPGPLGIRLRVRLAEHLERMGETEEAAALFTSALVDDPMCFPAFQGVYRLNPTHLLVWAEVTGQSGSEPFMQLMLRAGVPLNTTDEDADTSTLLGPAERWPQAWLQGEHEEVLDELVSLAGEAEDQETRDNLWRALNVLSLVHEKAGTLAAQYNLEQWIEGSEEAAPWVFRWAVGRWDQLLEAIPSEALPVWVALSSEATGQASDAVVESLNAAHAADPRDATVLRALYRVHMRRGEHEAALQHLETVLRAAESAPGRALGLMEIAFAGQGFPEDQAAYLVEALNEEPSFGWAHRGLVRQAESREDRTTLRSLLRARADALATGREAAELHFRIAVGCQLPDQQAVIESLQRSVAADPSFDPAAMMLSQVRSDRPEWIGPHLERFGGAELLDAVSEPEPSGLESAFGQVLGSCGDTPTFEGGHPFVTTVASKEDSQGGQFAAQLQDSESPEIALEGSVHLGALTEQQLRIESLQSSEKASVALFAAGQPASAEQLQAAIDTLAPHGDLPASWWIRVASASEGEAARHAWQKAYAQIPKAYEVQRGHAAMQRAEGHASTEMLMPLVMSELDAALEEGQMDWARAQSEASNIPYISRAVHHDAAAALEAWEAAADALGDLIDTCHAAEIRSGLMARQRWILAEKLAHSSRALTLFQQLHEAEPDNREVLEALAKIVAASGDVELGRTYLTQLFDAAETAEEKASVLCRLAEIESDAGQQAQARETYAKALDYDPSNRAALEGLALLAEQEGDWRSVIAICRRRLIMSDADEAVGILVRIAELTQAHDGDLEVSKEAWRAVLREDPTNVPAARSVMQLVEASQDWRVFDEISETLLALIDETESSRLFFERGRAAAEAGRGDVATENYLKAVSGQAPYEPALRELEKSARAVGDWSSVVDLLTRRAHLAEGEQGTKLLEEASQLAMERLQDRDTALALFEQQLVTNPDEPAVLQGLSRLYLDSGRKEEALGLLVRLLPTLATSADPSDFDSLLEVSNLFFETAEIQRELGSTEEALLNYEEALRFNPRHLPSLEAVSPLYMERERWEDAERTLQEVLQLRGGLGDSYTIARNYTMLGVVEQHQQKLERSRKRFTKALDTLPDYVPALKGMANVLEANQEWDSLLQVYNTIIQRTTLPADVELGYLKKGLILDVHFNRLDKAVEHYDKCLAFDTKQTLAHLRLVELALRMGDPEVAMLRVRQALDLEEIPMDHHVLFLLGWGLAGHAQGRLDEADEAMAQLQALKGLDTSGEVERLYFDLGDAPLTDLHKANAYLKERAQA